MLSCRPAVNCDALSTCSGRQLPRTLRNYQVPLKPNFRSHLLRHCFAALCLSRTYSFSLMYLRRKKIHSLMERQVVFKRAIQWVISVFNVLTHCCWHLKLSQAPGFPSCTNCAACVRLVVQLVPIRARNHSFQVRRPCPNSGELPHFRKITSLWQLRSES